MGKHITDHADTMSSARMKQFLEIERKSGADGANPAAKVVHRQTLTRVAGKRLKEFARIDRGETA